MDRIKAFIDLYTRDIIHVSLMFAFWPMGEKGLFISYALTYCLSKRRGAHPFFTCLNFILLLSAVYFNQVGTRYHDVLLTRDVLVLLFLIYRGGSGCVRNVPAKGRILLFTFSMTVIVSQHLLFHHHQQSTLINVVFVTLDMLHADLEYLLDAEHGEHASILLYYTVLCIKSVLYFGQAQSMPYLQLLIAIQLDFMSYTDPASIHASLFKTLSTMYVMTCFFI